MRSAARASSKMPSVTLAPFSAVPVAFRTRDERIQKALANRPDSLCESRSGVVRGAAEPVHGLSQRLQRRRLADGRRDFLRVEARLGGFHFAPPGDGALLVKTAERASMTGLNVAAIASLLAWRSGSRSLNTSNAASLRCRSASATASLLAGG